LGAEQEPKWLVGVRAPIPTGTTPGKEYISGCDHNGLTGHPPSVTSIVCRLRAVNGCGCEFEQWRNAIGSQLNAAETSIGSRSEVVPVQSSNGDKASFQPAEHISAGRWYVAGNKVGGIQPKSHATALIDLRDFTEAQSELRKRARIVLCRNRTTSSILFHRPQTMPKARQDSYCIPTIHCTLLRTTSLQLPTVETQKDGKPASRGETGAAIALR
jgi:hypothetical protein